MTSTSQSVGCSRKVEIAWARFTRGKLAKPADGRDSPAAQVFMLVILILLLFALPVAEQD